MKPYEWMVEYTPQTGWIEGHGVLIWLAEATGMLGGGLYIVSLFLGSGRGAVVGFLLTVIVKGGFHLAHLGRPSRFWRLFLRPATSWLSRGLFLVALFAVLGGAQLATSLWLDTSWAALNVASGVAALLVAGYSGFVMNFVSAVPFWNSALLPLLFAVFGVLGGSGLIMLAWTTGLGADAAAVLGLAPLPVIVSFSLLALFLASCFYMGPAARRSAREIVAGRLAPAFWLGVVLCGAALPLGAAAYCGVAGAIPAPAVAACGLGMVVAVFAFNYCLLKGGLYRPLAPAAP